MAIAISVSAGAKRQHPQEQFASISTIVSLTGEAGSLADVAPVMRDLLATAQAGCDQHLAEQVAALTGTPPTAPASSRPATQPQANNQPRSTPRGPSPTRPDPRRGMPPISDAQKRLLDRLLDGDPQRADEICRRAGVSNVTFLSMKAASEAIDWLRSHTALT